MQTGSMRNQALRRRALSIVEEDRAIDSVDDGAR
jgi:hypothetical protein